MKDHSKKIETVSSSSKQPTELQPDINEHNNLNKSKAYEDIERDLNSKIMQVTMNIKDHYPELSKFLEEMPGTIPAENNPDITLKNLKSYYDSLNSLLNKYILEQPQNAK